MAAVGAFQILGGLDNVYTGTNTAVGAPSRMTIGGELLQQTGLSVGGAELVYGALQLGTGYGAIKFGTAKGVFSAPENVADFNNAAQIEGNFYRDGAIVDIGGNFGKFENGASILAPADILDKYSVVGRADGLFVSSPAYINALLQRTGGNNTLIKAELGIEPQYWSGPLVKIDISNPLRNNPRLPSGLESGANSLFIRGGFTPSGAPEIVIDPVLKKSVISVPVHGSQP
jgi:hypothetical protein